MDNEQKPDRSRNINRYLIIALLVILYVGSYVVLSFNGEYEIKTRGLAGYRRDRWVYAGIKGRPKSLVMIILYFPLYYCDYKLIHKDREVH